MGPDLKCDGVSEFYVWKDSLYVYIYIFILIDIYILYVYCLFYRKGLQTWPSSKQISQKLLFACVFFLLLFLFERSLSNFQFQYPGSISHSEVHTTAKSSSRASKDGVSLLAP